MRDGGPIEQLHERFGELGQICPARGRDHGAVDHVGTLHEHAADSLDIGCERRVGRDPTTLHVARCRRHLHAVAHVTDGQPLVEEVRHDPLHVRVVADHLGRPAARNEHGHIRCRIDLRKGHVRVQPTSGTLHVRVPTRLEIVHDELQALALRRSHVDGVPSLAQPVEHVVDLELLARVRGQDQNALHVSSSRRRA